jgi:hypothetical protein
LDQDLRVRRERERELTVGVIDGEVLRPGRGR